MSDTPGQAPEPAAAAGQAPATTSSGQVQGDTSLLDGELSGEDTFPRDYVEKLRQEAGGYRTKLRDLEPLAPWGEFAKEYGEHFSSPDDLRGFLGNFASQESAVRFAAAILQQAGLPVESLFGQQPQPGAEDELKQPMTRAEFLDWQRQQESTERMRQEDAEVKRLMGDLKIPEQAHSFVVAAAIQEPAHLGYEERLKRGLAAYNKAVSEHAQSLTATEESNRANAPGSLGGSSPSAEPEAPAKDLDEARRRAAARLDAIARADSLS